MVLIIFLISSSAVQAFVKLPGKARQIDLNRFNTRNMVGVDAAHLDSQIYTWVNGNWQVKFNQTAAKVVMDNANRPWVLKKNKEVWRFAGTLGWIKEASSALDLDIGHNNSVFILGPTYQYTDANNKSLSSNLYQYLSGAFVPSNEGSVAVKVRVDQKGLPWLLTAGGSLVFKNSLGQWEFIQARLRDFDVNSMDQLYGIEQAPFRRGNGALVKFENGRFVRVPGYGVQIALSYQGLPYVVNDLYEIWGHDFASASLEDFGYLSMKTEGKPNLGKRPVLVIPVRYQDTVFETGLVGPRMNQTFFDQSGTAMTIESYMRSLSQGRFEITPAPSFPFTLVHPLKMHCAHRNKQACPEAPKGKMLSAFDELLNLPVVERYDFSIFDTNGDKKITDDELILVFYQATLDPFKTGGINRGFINGCAKTERIKKVKLCTRMVLVAERTGKATIAHEIMHSLGAEDIYGAMSRMNFQLSLMGGTVSSAYDKHEYFHLDPWHKMKLGWLEPKIVPVSLAQSRFAVDEFKLELASKPGADKALLLYDPARGTSEGYLLEYRAAIAGDFDENTQEAGVRVWYFKTKRNGYLEDRRAFILAGKNKIVDSLVEGDDVFEPNNGDGFISYGVNQILEAKLKKSSDDITAFDKALFTINAAFGGSSKRQFGSGGAWTPFNTPVAFYWPDELNPPFPSFNIRVMDIPDVNTGQLNIEIY